MKHNLLLLLAIIAVGCNTSKAYNAMVKNAKHQKRFIHDFDGNGIIYLKNGNSLTGLIKTIKYYDSDHELDSSNSPVEILLADKTEKKDIQTIYLSDISSVKIQKANEHDSTEFKPFGGTLAVLLGTKNQISLYCRYWHWQTSVDVNNSLTASSAEILLTFNGKLSDHFGTLKKSSQRWYDYRQFIDKKYHEHFNKYYFKGKDEKLAVSYILDKENARMSHTGNL